MVKRSNNLAVLRLPEKFGGRLSAFMPQ
jgi:hypothetical protein